MSDTKLARFLQRRRAGDPATLAGAIVEHPLDLWVDIQGSKLRPLDFLSSLGGLLRIRRRYF